MTQDDVDGMVAAGLNSVRIPVGFWVIEDIVQRSNEPYAEGGLDELVCFFYSLRSLFLASLQTLTATDPGTGDVQRRRVFYFYFV